LSLHLVGTQIQLSCRTACFQPVPIKTIALNFNYIAARICINIGTAVTLAGRKTPLLKVSDIAVNPAKLKPLY